MAETSSLLNCRTGSRTGGSNPPPSAPRGFLCESMGRLTFSHLPRDSDIQIHLMSLAARSIHLMVRIQDSQSWHRGSIPLSTTKALILSAFFVIIPNQFSHAKNIAFTASIHSFHLVNPMLSHCENVTLTSSMWHFVVVYVALCGRLYGTCWPPMWHMLIDQTASPCCS